MGQLDQKWDRLIAVLFNYPSKNFRLRELSRLTKLPKTTLQRYLNLLLKQKLIQKEKKGANLIYQASENDFFYKYYKKNRLIEEIYNSGLIDFLEDTFHPQAVILFGSGAKGEYVKESDLDIFLLAGEKAADLKKFEKKIKRKINLLFKEDYAKLSRELFNNIINGYKLSGYIKLK